MKTNRICNTCKQPVEIKTELDYPFYCPHCDENRYGFETTDETPNKTVHLYAHTIEYWWEWDKEFPDYEHELSESDEEHICRMLAENCVQGELCSIEPDDREIYGWWKIQN